MAEDEGSKKETSRLTGFSVKDIIGEGSIFIAAGFIAVILAAFVAVKLYRRKQQ